MVEHVPLEVKILQVLHVTVWKALLENSVKIVSISCCQLCKYVVKLDLIGQKVIIPVNLCLILVKMIQNKNGTLSIFTCAAEKIEKLVLIQGNFSKTLLYSFFTFSENGFN